MSNYKHEASGATLYREIAQPNVATFAEVFEDFAPYDVMDKNEKHRFAPRHINGQAIGSNLFDDVKAIMNGRKCKTHPNYSMQVGPYCSRRDGDSFSVRCADWVLSRIKERTIIVPNDRMSFELVDHDNGWTLVVVNHGQILGGVWLAYIRTESIPKRSCRSIKGGRTMTTEPKHTPALL